MTRCFCIRAIFALALLAGFAGCGNKHSPPSSEAALRIGMDLSYPPFEMQDASGKPDGVSVQIATALAAHLKRPLQIVPMDFAGLIPALKSGHIDLILSSMTATEERRRSILFSKPYVFTGLAMLVQKTSTVRTIDDLRGEGRVVAVKAGTTGETWAIANLPQARRIVLTEPALCVLEVVQGRADAFLYDPLSVLRYAKQHRETTLAVLKPFTEEAWAVGLAQGNETLRQQVDAFLDEFRASGGLERLAAQYLAEEKTAMEAAGVPFLLR